MKASIKIYPAKISFDAISENFATQKFHAIRYTYVIETKASL